jgi:16S rRNA (uracil1498-N3)-methyltransferase
MSQLSLFFHNGPLAAGSIVVLDDDTSKHVWQVLRMQEGDALALTDGKGNIAEGRLVLVERHRSKVKIEHSDFQDRVSEIFHLCVGFTKNNNRNEWMLEKATELGVTSIIPIAAARSEKAHFRLDRWQKILTSAILQSRQHYLPLLADIAPLPEVLQKFAHVPQKFVAHCLDDDRKDSLTALLQPNTETVLLIGPEGDFTKAEIELCIAQGFRPVSLGRQRLRTETAAITACAYFNVLNDGKA